MIGLLILTNTAKFAYCGPPLNAPLSCHTHESQDEISNAQIRTLPVAIHTLREDLPAVGVCILFAQINCTKSKLHRLGHLSLQRVLWCNFAQSPKEPTMRLLAGTGPPLVVDLH